MQPGEEAAARSSYGAAAAALGGSGPWPLFFLGDGTAMEELPPLLAGCQDEENLWILVASLENRVSLHYIEVEMQSSPWDGYPLIQGQLGTSRSFLGTLSALMRPQFVFWRNPSNLVRVGVNKVTIFQILVIRYLPFIKRVSRSRTNSDWAKIYV